MRASMIRGTEVLRCTVVADVNGQVQRRAATTGGRLRGADDEATETGVGVADTAWERRRSGLHAGTSAMARKRGHSRRRLCYIIPGNPGDPRFYSELVEAIAARVSEDAGKTPRAAGDEIDIVSVGHMEHNRESGRLVGLSEQIEHHERLLAEHLLTRGGEATVDGEPCACEYDSITVVGHSIGAYLAICALQRLNEASRRRPSPAAKATVDRLVMMMPFLETDYSQLKQRLIATVASSRVLSGIFWLIILLFRVLLPSATTREKLLTVFLAPGMTRNSIALTARTLAANENFLMNCFHLARDEFRELSTPHWRQTLASLRDGTAPAVHADGLSFIYAPDDDWAPASMLEKVGREYEDDRGVHIAIDDRLSHGFVTKQDEIVHAANVLARIILPGTTGSED